MIIIGPLVCCTVMIQGETRTKPSSINNGIVECRTKYFCEKCNKETWLIWYKILKKEGGEAE